VEVGFPVRVKERQMKLQIEEAAQLLLSVKALAKASAGVTTMLRMLVYLPRSTPCCPRAAARPHPVPRRRRYQLRPFEP
jgi:hypothetical protein